MKKIWILFLICLFITCPVLGCPVTKNQPITHPDGTIEYDFSKQSQTKASKILYKFVLKELNKTPREAQDFANITPKTVSAFETDLNGDGKKEIIGVVFSTYYSCTEGFKLFILEQQNNITYVDLSGVYFLPNEKIHINNNIINNYKEIEAKCYNNYYRLKGEFVESTIYLFFQNNSYQYNYLKMKANI